MMQNIKIKCTIIVIGMACLYRKCAETRARQHPVVVFLVHTVSECARGREGDFMHMTCAITLL